MSGRCGCFRSVGGAAAWLGVVLCVAGVPAQTWVRGAGEVRLANITPEEARRKALEIARLSALESSRLELVGATARLLQESPADSVLDIFSRFTRTSQRGRIVDERIIFDDLIRLPGADGYVWRVETETRVEPDTAAPDPSFRLEVGLDRQVFRAGEAMRLAVSATRDCWVTVFVLFGTDSMQVLVPNKFLPDNYLPAGKPLYIPPPEAGWALAFDLASELKSSPEMIWAVATRDQVPFVAPGMGERLDLRTGGQGLVAINNWLVGIPADRRTEAFATYTVYR